MRKIMPMQPADVAAWLEIAHIAAEKLQGSGPWALPSTQFKVRMKNPGVDDWVEWALKEPMPDHEVLKALLLHEFMHQMYGHLPSFDMPDECRVVSLMQNDGECGPGALPTTPLQPHTKNHVELEIDSFVAPPTFFLEFLREFNRASSASIIPEECDVVSLMQNDGE